MSESVVYEKTLEAMWEGGAGAVSGTVKAVGVDTAVYVRSAAHQWLSDLTGIVSAPVVMPTKTFAAGLFSHPLVVLTGVTGGENLRAVITYVDTGTPGTSRLLTYTDLETDSTTISIAGTGEAITCEWPNGVGRI